MCRDRRRIEGVRKYYIKLSLCEAVRGRAHWVGGQEQVHTYLHTEGEEGLQKRGETVLNIVSFDTT